MVTKEISERETKSCQGRETMSGRRRGQVESREQARLERPGWAGKEEAETQDRSTGYLEGAVPNKTGGGFEGDNTGLLGVDGRERKESRRERN